MSNPTQFEGWPVGGVDTPQTGSSKRDGYAHDTVGSGLGGNQHIQTNILSFRTHLPHSGAGGAPLHESAFGAAHRWTEADGKVNDGVGPGQLNW